MVKWHRAVLAHFKHNGSVEWSEKHDEQQKPPSRLVDCMPAISDKRKIIYGITWIMAAATAAVDVGENRNATTLYWWKK